MYLVRNLLLISCLLTSLQSSDESNETKSTGFFNFDKQLFISHEDGKFDISDFLSTKYGFMPMPIIVTEPAVGYGGGLNLMLWRIYGPTQVWYDKMWRPSEIEEVKK